MSQCSYQIRRIEGARQPGIEAGNRTAVQGSAVKLLQLALMSSGNEAPNERIKPNSGIFTKLLRSYWLQ